ncbi:MAG TPA: ribonuclease HII [Candidatus Cloacimonetes bacterium]|jgi:ribonuclease HII|nr:ribonuclease HII [Candidatus Cloacimonas sp.]HHZ15653.1 ribonuclease HII [Candidatus Cloacimonadota bacterium]
MNPLYTADLRLLSEHSTLIGVDEAGRGCLAGPLVCAAVVLDYELIFDKLKDSKQLSPTVREELYRLIIDSCATYSIQVMPVEYIDQHNILNATMEGMRRAILALGITQGLCLVDGNRLPPLTASEAKDLQLRSVVHGDDLHASIAAASILAKVYRDQLMLELDKEYPHYGFATHKAYGTKAHLEAIDKYGPCPVHRKSFAPMKYLQS